MIHPDLLVGVVAMGVAIFTLLSAIADLDFAFNLRTVQRFEKAFGRLPARILLGFVGLLMMGVGIFLLHGLTKTNSSSQSVLPTFESHP